MRNRRAMMMMAGLLPEPWEQQANRVQRKLNRYAADLERRAQLITLMQRRERGEDGVKPMPFARKSDG
jgi:hypothetical protein